MPFFPQPVFSVEGQQHGRRVLPLAQRAPLVSVVREAMDRLASERRGGEPQRLRPDDVWPAPAAHPVHPPRPERPSRRDA